MVEQERAFKGEDVVRFLKTCDAPDYTGKLLINLGRLSDPASRPGSVKDFLASGAAERLQLEQLPGYTLLQSSTL